MQHVVKKYFIWIILTTDVRIYRKLLAEIMLVIWIILIKTVKIYVKLNADHRSMECLILILDVIT